MAKKRAKRPTAKDRELQRQAAKVATKTGKSAAAVLALLQKEQDRPTRRPYQRKKHNLDQQQGGYYLYATNKDKVNHNNALLRQQLAEVRRKVGEDPYMPYHFETVIDDPHWLFRAEDTEGPDEVDENETSPTPEGELS